MGWWWLQFAVAKEPQVSSDGFRPVVDAGPYATVESGRLTGPVVSLQSAWVNRPIRRIDPDGTIVPVITHALALHLGARSGFGPVQLGVNAPVYPVRIGPDDPRLQAVVGDPMAEALVVSPRTWGTVGALVRVGVPLGGADRQLGYPGPFGDVGGLLTFDRYVVKFAVNLGFRVTPTQRLGLVEFDDGFWARIGVSVPLRDRGGLAAEAFGGVSRRGPVADASPIELLFSGRWAVRRGLMGWAGVGRGVSRGVGSPAVRVAVGLRFALDSDLNLLDP